MRAGVDGSAALFFCSLAILDEMVRLEDRDVRMRQERHVYAGSCGRINSDNDMAGAMLGDSCGGAFNFLGQNALPGGQSARVESFTARIMEVDCHH